MSCVNMRRYVRFNSNFPMDICPECDGSLVISFSSNTSHSSITCESCPNFKSLFKCSTTKCKFKKMICLTCDSKQFRRQQSSSMNLNEKSKTFDKIYNCNRGSSSKLIIVFGVMLILLIVFITNHLSRYSEKFENMNINDIKKLSKRYYLQKNETWYHFMGVLENNIPTVKTIIFLHGEDRRTSDCLMNELVSLYTQNKNIKNEDITFSCFECDFKDYGIVLEHYRSIVQKFRILITDLSKVTGNTARIFHSLCDEISSDTKPSLFIFTLRNSKETANLKPVERATTFLKEAWNDLPENELFPLLSRIIKNVVDIVSEEQVLC